MFDFYPGLPHVIYTVKELLFLLLYNIKENRVHCWHLAQQKVSGMLSSDTSVYKIVP